MKEWNLKEIYSSNEEILKDLEVLKVEAKKVTTFKGKLNSLSGIESFFDYERCFSKKVEKLLNVIMMTFDLNQNDLNSQSLVSKSQSVLVEYSADASFIDSELLKLSFDDYKEMAKLSPTINANMFRLKKLFDSKKHVLTPAEEKIMSNYGNVTSSFSNLYSMLENTDTKPVTITLSNGKKVEVNKSNYTSLLMKEESQEDRKKTFEAMYAHYDQHKNTFASIYKGVIDSDIAYMKNKGYKTILGSALDYNKIPDEVFLSLINTVKENTAPLKKYINLRKKYFKLNEYHTYDRFLSFSTKEVSYPYEKAYDEVMKALAPMGEDFVNHAKVALKEGHVDVYPHPGKRSGAYSGGIYGYGPYILLNHTDTLDSAFTLAHECGHSIHTLYSEEFQPYETKDYTIFVAEIASTFNEQLFLDYLLKNSNDKELKIQALEQQINGIVSTFYRQTLFADYEYQAHELALKGEGITYESLGKIMEDLYQQYYGINLETEPLKKYVWAYIPHLFHTPFYVYQYATCFSASMKIYQDIHEGKKGAKEAYLNMLKAGGSDYPVEIVKKAGVDLTSSSPFEAVCNKLDELTDKLSELLETK